MAESFLRRLPEHCGEYEHFCWYNNSVTFLLCSREFRPPRVPSRAGPRPWDMSWPNQAAGCVHPGLWICWRVSASFMAHFSARRSLKPSVSQEPPPQMELSINSWSCRFSLGWQQFSWRLKLSDSFGKYSPVEIISGRASVSGSGSF